MKMQLTPRLPITPEATARRMLKSYKLDRALDAAHDYRHNMYRPGEPGHEFWTSVISLLEKPDALG
jgi:hypothetical protein